MMQKPLSMTPSAIRRRKARQGTAAPKATKRSRGSHAEAGPSSAKSDSEDGSEAGDTPGGGELADGEDEESDWGSLYDSSDDEGDDVEKAPVPNAYSSTSFP
jgi:hypothetical protein